MKDDTLQLVMEEAREQVLAFGLLTARESTLYEDLSGGESLRLTKATRPMGYLYRLYLSSKLAGTVYMRRETNRWMHAGGILVAEQYRGNRIRNSMPGDGAHPDGDSVGALLTRCWTHDLVSAGFQLTAETLNGNVRAWRLLERTGYSLLNDLELRAYAAWRRKRIKRQFPVEGGHVVQWDHVADDAFDLQKFSANRVYGKRSDDAPFAFMSETPSRLGSPLRVAASVIWHGSLLHLARHRLWGRGARPVGRGSDAVDPDLQRGVECLQDGKSDDAIEAFQAVIERSPNAIRARGLLAEAHLQNHNLPEAIRIAEEALMLAPDFAPAHSALASACAARGEYQRAIKHMDRAIDLGAELPEDLPRMLDSYR